MVTGAEYEEMKKADWEKKAKEEEKQQKKVEAAEERRHVMSLGHVTCNPKARASVLQH
ncbi:hypothetical protein FRC02_011034 [Tulasnella sp. 418]|nr:hypothetical protein FRC02_011034 [Tulasnella sp. 418]